MLACKDSQVNLSELEGTVLKHTNLMKGLTTFVGKGISVPDTIFSDPKNVEDALKTTLEEVNGALVSLVFFFNLFRVLLSSIDIIHNVLELLASGLELSLRSVTNTV